MVTLGALPCTFSGSDSLVTVYRLLAAHQFDNDLNSKPLSVSGASSTVQVSQPSASGTGIIQLLALAPELRTPSQART